MTPRDTAALLKTWALEAGFDRAGIAVLDRAAHGDAFVRWLEAGHQAGMSYLERRIEHRLEPERLVPGARSVLCVALRYLVPQDETVEGDLWPRVARYARGDDYHELMGRRLEALCARIERAFPGTVDPPLRRHRPGARARVGGARRPRRDRQEHQPAASRAMGRTSCSARSSSASISSPTCRSPICAEAAAPVSTPVPTGALPAPYLLDSRLCISYWTIEHRGAIPAEVRPLVGDWVFGCDVCQEVCPWNAAPEAASEPALALPESRRRLSLVDLLELRRDDVRGALSCAAR